MTALSNNAHHDYSVLLPEAFIALEGSGIARGEIFSATSRRDVKWSREARYEPWPC